MTMQGRIKPYTQEQIRKRWCIRCGEPAIHQWQICADDNIHRPICEACDIELNELVLKFMGFRDYEKKMVAYKEKFFQGDKCDDMA